MDESTSALDSQTESSVKAAINKAFSESIVPGRGGRGDVNREGTPPMSPPPAQGAGGGGGGGGEGVFW